MTITITPAKLSGTVTPPPSKSQAHRLLIAAALARGKSTVSNVAYSRDIQATVSCLSELGAGFTVDGSTITVWGMGANHMSPMRRMAYPQLDCGESGSTLRFLIPIALAVRAGGIFRGHGRLMQRPLKPYFDIFDEKGVSYKLMGDTLSVAGLLTPGSYRLPGDISSQFFSGLLFALPLLDGPSVIIPTTMLESEGYVQMTLQAMDLFGVSFPMTMSLPPQYHPAGNQTYTAAHVTVDADWSQAAFWYAANFLGSGLEITGLNECSAQGDSVITHYMTRLAEPGEQEIDMSGYPDLAPPLSAMAALRAGETTRLVNADRLRLKESDRLSSTAQVLGALGADVEEGPNSLTIRGKDKLPGGVTVDSHNDHRIAMMTAIAATGCVKPVTLTGASCVEKSYPNFWFEYERLGGKVLRLP